MNPTLFSLLTFGDYADLYWEEASSLSISWEEGKVERFTGGQECGAGLRYRIGDENRYASIDDPNDDAIALLARQLIGPLALPATKPSIVPLPLRLSRPSIGQPFDQIPADRKVALVKSAYEAASIPSVRQISIHYGESVKQVRILTSEGEQSEEWRSVVTFSIKVVAEKEGTRQTAYEAISGSGGFELFTKHDVIAIARKVARRAVDRLSAPPAPLGEMPVIIAAEAGGTLIHEAIGHPLEADAVQKGVSPVYQGAIGKIVGNEKVSVLEDPTMPGQRGYYAFDDEGTPAQRVVLIDHGVLKTYLYDRQTARKDGVRSNGHGRRESFRHRPIPRMANTFVAPGPDDPQAILHSIPNGLLVTRMGGGQVEPATGDFVFEVEEGFLIKDGQVGSLIRSANLLGNGPDVLKAIDLVGSDMGWSVGTCGKDGQGAPVSDGLPTLRIPRGVVVGGVAS
ncbi:MAG: TldD/PmbA family protein [Elusimicrobiota bacterium]|jgi:TldD protein